jgi:hypothetical protein
VYMEQEKNQTCFCLAMLARKRKKASFVGPHATEAGRQAHAAIDTGRGNDKRRETGHEATSGRGVIASVHILGRRLRPETPESPSSIASNLQSCKVQSAARCVDSHSLIPELIPDYPCKVLLRCCPSPISII